MSELLLELLSKEIPARMQAQAAADLQRLVCDGLKGADLAFSSAQSFVTPRRLTLVIEGLPERQPDVSEERRGPRIDAPDKAIQGFLRATGLTLEQCEHRDSGKGVFWYAVIDRKGRSTVDVLVETLSIAITALPWPKSMRWGSETVRWVRPLQSILCLFDGRVVPFGFGPILSADATLGHRFLAPAPISAVKNFADYRQRLEAAKVLLDAADRRRVIAEEAALLAEKEGLSVKEDRGLLDEVTGLVEWPVVRMGRIDESFMDIPGEVLATAMRSHQKYFSLLGKDGKLAPRFVVVANRETADGEQQIVAGNERVLRARLSDARFFWDQDRKCSLESRVADLKNLIFHAKLGTIGDKVSRLETLAAQIAGSIDGANPDLAAHAARLSKADLGSGMVGEFPELQGIMGRYYAAHDGEPEAVADAVGDHYAPQGPNDRCPMAPLSVAVSLADKIDTLVGFFAVDETPTGSKDPFALRRAALGVIRLIVENGLRLPLGEVFRAAHAGYGSGALAMPTDKVGGALLAFFAERLKVHLRDQGMRHDLIAAVFALGGEDDLVRLIARVRALQDFLASDDGANLLIAYRRASNIVAIEEKKDGKSFDGAVSAGALAEALERDLFDQLGQATPNVEKAVSEERFADAMGILAGLRGPVDDFFEKVTVNAEDGALRENRLRLLSGIRRALGGVADFSIIEG
jgi:glycyl-tRNA synthetase beta chain